jgi:hypothetical protein
MGENTKPIKNIKNYLLKCLINAPATINYYTESLVNQDFPQFTPKNRNRRKQERKQE